MNARNIILTLAAAALMVAPAFAQGGPGGGGWGQGGQGGGSWGQRGPAGGHGLGFFERMLPRVAEEIGLTDEQLAEIQTIIDEARPAIEELTDQLRTLRMERRENHDPAVFNEFETRSFAQQKADVEVEVMVVVDKTRAEVLQVLTEEQRQQLEEMRGNFGQGRFQRGSGRRGNQ
jgi:Spy/CpxP family protein refolding chaperone